MTLKKLSEEGRLKSHSTSKQEIQHLLRVVQRDLKDSGVQGLSLDRKFATAYSSALQAGRAILAAAGYRTSGQGHHMTVFNALRFILDKDQHITLDYFNDCRNKRNLADYGVSGIISEKEVKEIVVESKKFSEFTHRWIREQYPDLI